ncbi:MAG: cytochrome c [Deltaproteobacteria bacterium]|nr:cytochrome c [Deltaproteobacteria bacterium]
MAKALFLLATLFVSACSGAVSGQDHEPSSGPTGPNAPGEDPSPGDKPDTPATDTPIGLAGVQGILGCPTVPLPAYGSPPVATLSKPFQSNCAACHGGAGEGSAKYPALPGKLSLPEFIAKVRSGINEMPAFAASFISDAQLTADFDALKKGAQPASAQVDVPLTWSQGKLDEIYTQGLQVWRKPGSIDGQACTNCHSADGVEMAIIGFTDDAILRRAQQHLSAEDALVVRDFVHAQRRRFNIAKVCSPDWRPFQPGGEVLPGNTPNEQDASFLAELQKRKLLVATGKVVTLADAQKALAELQAIDLRQLPIGIPLPRWSEDKFNGPAHRDINDYMAPIPTVPNRPEEYFAVEDEYLRAPTDQNLYKVLDQNRKNMNDLGFAKKNSTPHMGGNCPAFNESTGWILQRITQPKRLSTLLAAHLFRQELAKPGSFYKRPASPFPDAPAAANPAFFMGAFAIEPPCYDAVNYSSWIKAFPSGFRDEFPESDLKAGVVENATDRITHVWMTLGQVMDPTLIATDPMQDNKIHYWAFRNFKQSEVHLPFMYVHRMAMQALYRTKMLKTEQFPKISGPFDEANRDWLHPFLATRTQNSAGLRSAADPEAKGFPGVAVNRFKGNLLRMMLLISQDLLKSGMPIQTEQNSDHCLSLFCNYGEMRGFTSDLKAQASKASAKAIYDAQGFDLDLYMKDTDALLTNVEALATKAPRR